jgi:hypothetical protein
VHTRPDGDHYSQVVRGYLFNCLQLVELVLGTRGSFRAAMRQKVGAGAQATRGGPGATPSRETGARAARTRGGPRDALSREVGARATGTRGGPRATPSWKAGAGALGHTATRTRLVFCLYLELIHGGTWSSGTDSGPTNEFLRK